MRYSICICLALLSILTARPQTAAAEWGKIDTAKSTIDGFDPWVLDRIYDTAWFKKNLPSAVSNDEVMFAEIRGDGGELKLGKDSTPSTNYTFNGETITMRPEVWFLQLEQPDQYLCVRVEFNLSASYTSQILTKLFDEVQQNYSGDNLKVEFSSPPNNDDGQKFTMLFNRFYETVRITDQQQDHYLELSHMYAVLPDKGNDNQSLTITYWSKTWDDADSQLNEEEQSKEEEERSNSRDPELRNF